MIVLDANVLIGHFESTDAHHKAATELLLAYAAEPLSASIVTLAEVYVGATRVGQADRLELSLARLHVTPLELPADSARRLGELRTITNLRTPDCCVLFTAEHYGGAIATFDEKLAARAAALGVPVAPTHPIIASE